MMDPTLSQINLSSCQVFGHSIKNWTNTAVMGWGSPQIALGKPLFQTAGANKVTILHASMSLEGEQRRNIGLHVALNGSILRSAPSTKAPVRGKSQLTPVPFNSS